MFTYSLQHSASQRSTFFSSQNCGCSYSHTVYNSRLVTGQRSARLRNMVSHVHLLATRLSEPESAIFSSQNRGCSCSHTIYSSPLVRNQFSPRPRTMVGSV